MQPCDVCFPRSILAGSWTAPPRAREGLLQAALFGVEASSCERAGAGGDDDDDENLVGSIAMSGWYRVLPVCLTSRV